jgi:hypothetical protein
MSFTSQSVLSTEAMVDFGAALLENSIVVFIVDSFKVLLADTSYDKVVHGFCSDIRNSRCWNRLMVYLSWASLLIMYPPW